MLFRLACFAPFCVFDRSIQHFFPPLPQCVLKGSPAKRWPARRDLHRGICRDGRDFKLLVVEIHTVFVVGGRDARAMRRGFIHPTLSDSASHSPTIVRPNLRLHPHKGESLRFVPLSDRPKNHLVMLQRRTQLSRAAETLAGKPASGIHHNIHDASGARSKMTSSISPNFSSFHPSPHECRRQHPWYRDRWSPNVP